MQPFMKVFIESLTAAIARQNIGAAGNVGELSDTEITGPADLDLIQRSGSKWKDKSLTEIFGALGDSNPWRHNRYTDAGAVTAMGAKGDSNPLNHDKAVGDPVGIVKMYDGTGIADADTRTEAIGDREGDTVEMPGWYVMNGQSGTPDLRNKFIRSENASGNTGGADTHTLTTTQIPAHNHSYENLVSTAVTNKINSVGSYTGGKVNTVQVARTTGNRGSGGAHNNMPAYYSLIFIKRMS